jgi:hypothetical protein
MIGVVSLHRTARVVSGDKGAVRDTVRLIELSQARRVLSNFQHDIVLGMAQAVRGIVKSPKLVGVDLRGVSHKKSPLFMEGRRYSRLVA